MSRGLYHQLPPKFQQPLVPHVRHFRSTPFQRDIFFASVPALKGGLLTCTRVILLMLPFVWRYKLWHKYRKVTIFLIQLPIFCICVVFALGLDQSPRTERWRLLLMSETEEMAWSRRRFEECLKTDGPLLLTMLDERTQRVKRVADRLVTALEEQEKHVICSKTWPPQADEWEKVHLNEIYKPSAIAESSYLPFRPESSNPLKKVVSQDWRIYVVDLPKINAFALPSKDLFVYSGLIELVDDDALLAAVLSHEMAHVTQRHAVENLGFLNVAAVGFDIIRGISYAFTISFPIVQDGAALVINWLNDVVSERAYSRKLECEADLVGLDFMSAAGYDPRAALDLWSLMAAVEADAAAGGKAISIQDKFALLRTHPTSSVRQAKISERIPAAMELYLKSPTVVNRKANEKLLQQELLNPSQDRVLATVAVSPVE